MNRPITRILGTTLAFGLVTLLALVTACKAKPEIDSFTISTVTPGSYIAGGPTSTPEPQVPYAISGIPHCQGLSDLGFTLTFDWPDIENALEKLAEYNWGYYACSQTQVELKSFMRDKMPKPPYLWQEVAWVEYGDNTGSLFFHSVFRSWIYIWMLRQPGNQNSHLVIAKGDPGMPQTWDCRLILPQIWREALATKQWQVRSLN